jgi:hypothetical protein
MESRNCRQTGTPGRCSNPTARATRDLTLRVLHARGALLIQALIRKGAFRDRWLNWVSDPLIEQTGMTFDRTQSGPIIAPIGKFRVCASHIDFDERATCWSM